MNWFKENPLVKLICAQSYEKWEFIGFRFRISVEGHDLVDISPHGTINIGNIYKGHEAVKNNSKVAAKYAELEYEMVKRKLAS